MMTDSSFVVGFDVGQQPNLLEQLERQTLRLVDDQHRGFAACRSGRSSASSSSSSAAFEARRFARQTELRCEHLDELVARQRRVVQMHAVHLLGLLLERRPNQRRLAGAGFADEQRDALAAGDAVLEVAQRLAVRLGQHQEPRVRRQVERPLAKAEELFVHQHAQRRNV